MPFGAMAFTKRETMLSLTFPSRIFSYFIIFLCFTTELLYGQCWKEVYFDGFNDQTDFLEKSQPYGDPYGCVSYSDYVSFGNNSDEHYIELGCDDEGELRKSFNLSSGNYEIELKWRAQNDGSPDNDCSYTNYDDQYLTNCSLPKRAIIINGSNVIHHISGQLTGNSITTTKSFNGSINKVYLAFGSNYSSYTYYDEFRIRKQMESSVDPADANASKASISPGESVTLTKTGGQLGDEADWYWYKNSCDGSLVGTGSSISVSPSSSTTYYVRAEGYCNITSCASVMVTVNDETDPTSVNVNKNTDENISIYPNPTSGTFYISIPENLQPTSLKIFDLNGKCVLSRNNIVKEQEINLPQGVYLVKTIAEGQPQQEKVIVK